MRAHRGAVWRPPCSSACSRARRRQSGDSNPSQRRQACRTRRESVARCGRLRGWAPARAPRWATDRCSPRSRCGRPARGPRVALLALRCRHRHRLPDGIADRKLVVEVLLAVRDLRLGDGLRLRHRPSRAAHAHGPRRQRRLGARRREGDGRLGDPRALRSAAAGRVQPGQAVVGSGRIRGPAGPRRAAVVVFVLLLLPPVRSPRQPQAGHDDQPSGRPGDHRGDVMVAHGERAHEQRRDTRADEQAGGNVQATPTHQVRADWRERVHGAERGDRARSVAGALRLSGPDRRAARLPDRRGPRRSSSRGSRPASPGS